MKSPTPEEIQRESENLLATGLTGQLLVLAIVELRRIADSLEHFSGGSDMRQFDGMVHE
jgi:hypothetical protein